MKQTYLVPVKCVSLHFIIYGNFFAFHLHFQVKQWGWTCFHVFDFICVSSLELMSTQITYPVFSCTVDSLLSSCESSYIWILGILRETYDYQLLSHILYTFPTFFNEINKQGFLFFLCSLGWPGTPSVDQAGPSQRSTWFCSSAKGRSCHTWHLFTFLIESSNPQNVMELGWDLYVAFYKYRLCSLVKVKFSSARERPPYNA